MKAILEFNLDEEADDMALKRCHKSLAMANVLWEFLHNSRKRIEYDMNEVEYIAVQKVYTRFEELLDEHCILLEDLT